MKSMRFLSAALVLLATSNLWGASQREVGEHIGAGEQAGAAPAADDVEKRALVASILASKQQAEGLEAKQAGDAAALQRQRELETARLEQTREEFDFWVSGRLAKIMEVQQKREKAQRQLGLVYIASDNVVGQGFRPDGQK